MYVFYSISKYNNGQSVNEVIDVLQRKYKFLDKYDKYVQSRILDYSIEDILDSSKLNDILTKLFKEYLENNIMEVNTANNLIDTALMYRTTYVEYIHK